MGSGGCGAVVVERAAQDDGAVSGVGAIAEIGENRSGLDVERAGVIEGTVVVECAAGDDIDRSASGVAQRAAYHIFQGAGIVDRAGILKCAGGEVGDGRAGVVVQCASIVEDAARDCEGDGGSVVQCSGIVEDATGRVDKYGAINVVEGAVIVECRLIPKQSGRLVIERAIVVKAG